MIIVEVKDRKMNGLKVYMKVGGQETNSSGEVFYSRRGNGPIYRWRYEQKIEKWFSMRLHTDEVASSQLRLAAWKTVPETLQVKLGEHYLE